MTRQIQGHRGLEKRWFSVLWAVLLLFTAGFWPLTEEGRGACPGVCGDVNGSGAITAIDAPALFGYLYLGMAPPVMADCGDMDDYELTTLRDAAWLVNFVFKGGAFPDCDLGFPALVPTPSSDFTILHDPSFPAGAVLYTVTIVLENMVPVAGLTLPVQFWVDGVPAAIVAVTMGTTFPGGNVSTVAPPPASPPNSIRFGFWDPGAGVPAGSYVLATVDIAMAAAACPRPIEITYIDLPPLQGGVPVNYPMLLDAGLGGWEPTICPDVIMGDVNSSGTVTSADIIGLVRYVFMGGCLGVLAAADVDCSGVITAADIVVLVNYVFKAGAAPCPGCS